MSNRSTKNAARNQREAKAPAASTPPPSRIETRQRPPEKRQTSQRVAPQPISAPGRAPRSPILSVGPDEREAPARHGKSDRPEDMGFVVPTSDDEIRNTRHHPNDVGFVDFEVDPDRADAAADLAGDLGYTFLEAAVEGEETTEHVVGEPERAREQKPFLFDEETEGMYEEVLDEDLLDEEREEGHDDVALAPNVEPDEDRRPEDMEKTTARPTGSKQKP